MWKEGDLVLCTVEKIEGTLVFVKLSDNNQGTIITSEVAPGRIRNLRDYVVPKKKIVCKVLRVLNEHIDLSMRRVSAKEKKEVMDKYKQEQTAKSAINQLLKESAKEVEEKILKKFNSLYDFLIEAKENPKLLGDYIPKEFISAVTKLTQKKQKDVEVRKIIKLQCLEDDGIQRIKKILSLEKSAIVTYISAGKFQVKVKAENYKVANQIMNELTEKIEKSAKENSCECEILEKK